MAGAGVKSVDDVKDEAIPSYGVADADLNAESDSDLEFYKQVEQEHAAKLTAKAEKYSRFISMFFTIISISKMITMFFTAKDEPFFSLP